MKLHSSMRSPSLASSWLMRGPIVPIRSGVLRCSRSRRGRTQPASGERPACSSVRASAPRAARKGKSSSRATSMPPPGELRRCAIYTRKSTTAGLDQAFSSLDAQREACVEYVRRHPGWVVLDQRYDDGGFTGAHTGRPAFQRLLADVAAGLIDVVVVYKVDRLSRSLLDFVKVMEEFDAAGVAFVSVTQNFSTADAMGRLTLNVLMSFAEFEREMIRERTRDKVQAARRKGHWTGGKVPFGYVVVKKKLVVEELEAALVREIFTLYLDLRSALDVARMLHERGRTTRSGRRWTRNDVLHLLKYPVYAGYMVSAGELHDAEHQAIVERDVFARVQTLLASQTRARRGPSPNPEYILRGLLHCGCCGAAFTPASAHRGAIRHRYYRCVTRDKQGRAACPAKPLPAQPIEAHVIDRIRDALATGALAGEVSVSVQRRIDARRQEIWFERQALPRQIAALADEIRRFVDPLLTTTGAVRQALEDRVQQVDAQRARAEARLAAADQDLAALNGLEVDARWVADCLARFNSVWDMLTPTNRGRLVRAVVERVEVDEPAGEIRVSIVDLAAGLPDASLPALPPSEEGL